MELYEMEERKRESGSSDDDGGNDNDDGHLGEEEADNSGFGWGGSTAVAAATAATAADERKAAKAKAEFWPTLRADDDDAMFQSMPPTRRAMVGPVADCRSTLFDTWFSVPLPTFDHLFVLSSEVF